MSLSTFLQRTKAYMKRYATSKIISKTSLLQWLKNVIDTLQLVENGYNKLTYADKTKLRETIQSNLQYVDEPFVKKILSNYVKQLNNKAFIEESKVFLGSFIKTNKKLLSVLKKLNDNIDQFFKNESVQIGQIKLSQLSLLSIISQAQKFGEFTIYFISIIYDIASLEPGSKYKPTKYKTNILKNNYNSVIDIINNVVNKTKEYDFLREIKTEYVPSYDFSLGVINEHTSIIDTILSKLFRKNSLTMELSQGFFGLNIISIAEDLYQQYLYDKYRYTKTLKEWMEQRTALLKMDLNKQQNPNQKERLQKIVSRYEDLIAKYDRQIRDYETEFEEE